MPEDSAIFVNLKNKLDNIHPQTSRNYLYTFFRKIYKNEILKAIKNMSLSTNKEF